MTSPRGIHGRGYLPHWDLPGSTQAITYRLADALPTEVLQRLLAEIPLRPDGTTDEHARRARIEGWLDAGHGSCILDDGNRARRQEGYVS
jgi:putative transposase